MHLNAVIGILVGILRCHTLCDRCEGISQTGECLALCTLLCRELLALLLALALNVFKSLVDVHVA